MADSSDVLNGLIIVYTSYVLVIITIVLLFAYRLTTKGEGKLVKPAIFYTWIGFLIFTGVTIHIVTYNTIPWSPIDLNRKEIKADKVFEISVKNHKFILPAEKMLVKVNDKVLFNVNSQDLTYGFGLFRKDNSMLFQMQVIPGHNNDLLWQFTKPGIYTIRSTEYSGPKGVNMVEKDVVEVIE